MDDNYPATRTLLQDTRRLFPEERLEILRLLGRLARLEEVNKDAEALVDAYVGDKITDSFLAAIENLRARGSR